MRQLITNLWLFIRSFFKTDSLEVKDSERIKYAVAIGPALDDGALMYQTNNLYTVGPIVSLSKEQIDSIYGSEDASRRIVSAYYDYAGEFYMLFTGDAGSYMLPKSIFKLFSSGKIDPTKLKIIDNGRLVKFGCCVQIASAKILMMIEDMESEKKNETGKGTSLSN